ncbi:MAG: PAS domain S-box protein [Magnetovibrio sp.]|nr:PAS domain S-box protein [Magnetovibrio sp.]
MNWSLLKLRPKIILGILLPLLIVAVTSVMTVSGIRDITQTTKLVNLNQDVLSQARDIMAHAVEMETGMRGYLLSGKEGFLDPYTSGEKITYDGLASLQRTVFENPKQVERLVKVEQLLHEWQNVVSEPEIALRKNFSTVQMMTDMANMVGQAKGQAYFDKMRTLMAQFSAAEVALLSVREKRNVGTEDSVYILVVLGTVFALGLGFLLSWIISKNIGAPVLCMAEAMTKIATGEKNVEILALDRTDEIGEMARALDSFSKDQDVNKVLFDDMQRKVKEFIFFKDAMVQHSIVSISDVRGNITFVNDKFCNISGFSREDLLGHNYRMLKPKDYDPAFYEDMWATISGGKIWQGEIKNTTKDGGHYWVMASIVPCINETGEPFQYVDICTDITAVKMQELKLAKAKTDMEQQAFDLAAAELKLAKKVEQVEDNEKRTRAIVSTANDAIITFSDRGIVLSCNQQTVHIFGYAQHEIIGQNIDMLMPEPEKRKRNGVMSNGIGVGREVYGVNKKGDLIPLQLSVSEVKTRRETIFYGILRDLSAEKEAQSQLLQSEKMAALGSMVAGVAHEINTPVGLAVANVSELQDKATLFQQKLVKDGISKSDLKSFMDDTHYFSGVALDNLMRSAELIRNFKQVAVDQTSGEVREFDVLQQIKATIDTMKHKFKRTSIEFTVDCPKGILMNSVPGAISQILTNLAYNSFIHGFDNGHDQGNIFIDVEQDGDNITMIISDNGMGMRAKDTKRIFEPFFTTKRNEGGSGLGLHIVQNLVTTTLGGNIDVASVRGKGITFTIKAPLNYIR